MPHLKGAKRRVAEWILARPKEAASVESTAVWLGRESGTSDSAVVRLAQHLGYRGFPELKLELSSEVKERGRPVIDKEAGIESLEATLRRLHVAHLASITDTFEVLDVQRLQSAVRLLRGANRVVILGVGNSIPTCLSLQYRLLRLGLGSMFNQDVTLQAINAAAASAADCVVAVSHSGTTTEVINAAQLAKGRGARVLAMVSDADSSLARLSDLVLLSIAPYSEFHTEALASRLAQLALVDVLYVALAVDLGEEGLRSLELTEKAYAVESGR
jgi:DNA-binding MurR/RpiR family transcriptional regulator